MGIFPDARTANEDGIVAVGGPLRPEILLEAYKSGIFPWPQPDLPMLWFSPASRGVLDFEDLHIPDSLRKLFRRQSKWDITFNKATERVIHACARAKRKDQNGTWILPEMEKAYVKMAKLGHLLSVECWDADVLIGGLYGVQYESNNGPVFSGESMFHTETGASKICLWKLVEHLKSRGHKWIDTQMVTKVVELMGGKLISREEFLSRLGV